VNNFGLLQANFIEMRDYSLYQTGHNSILEIEHVNLRPPPGVNSGMNWPTILGIWFLTQEEPIQSKIF